MYEGALGHEFFVILDGSVRIDLPGRPVVRMGPGEFVGEMALLGHHPRSATVVAETDVTVLVSSQHEFSACLEGAPEVARRLLSGLADRLRAADEALAGGAGGRGAGGS
jgi:CRP-like cAMP-binding protein